MVKMYSHYAEKLIGKTMLKTLLFTILVMLLKPVSAASLMNHEKFVHLDYQEQRRIVIATMELIVEMESKYHQQVKTSGFDPERFRRYSEFMRKVSGLLFPEAHAAPVRNVRYGQYLNQLRTVLNQTGKCLYGGWISSMDRNNKCIHPARGSSANLYQSETGCTGGNNQITCNPAIFGFKNVASKTLFCVAAGERHSDNSSRDCMLKALADPPEAGASTREQRIRNMIDGISANPNDANAVFDFLLKACACDASQTPEISTHYANYMRPHQTCYSILRMMSEVTPQCQVNNQPLMDNNQTSFLADIRSVLTSTEVQSTNVADTYRAKVNQFVSRADHQAICGAPSGGGQNGGENTNTSGNCVNERLSTGGLCCNPGRRPNADNTNCEDGEPETNNGGVTVEGTTPDINTDTNSPDTNTDPGPNPDPNPNPDPDTTTDTPEESTPGPCDPVEHVREGANNSCVPACTEDQVRNPTTFACDPKPETEGDGDGDDEEASTSVSLTVTGTNKDENTTTVNVTINPADTDWSLYTLIWFSKGSLRPTKQQLPDSTSTDDSTPRGREDVDTVTDSEPQEAPQDWHEVGDGESSIRRDDQKSIDAPRLSNDYELCARLIKKSDNTKADEKCAKVPRKPAPRPSGNPMGGPQPMMPTRGGASDAIFRGVR